LQMSKNNARENLLKKQGVALPSKRFDDQM
jgi:hypothetical protein